MKKQQIHRFMCPHGRVHFVRHPRGYFLFKHPDDSTCTTLSRFSSTLQRNYSPNKRRRPLKIADLAMGLFSEMAKPFTDLLTDVAHIQNEELSLRAYHKEEQKRIADDAAKATEPVEVKITADTEKAVDELARQLMSTERAKLRQKTDKLVRELQNLSDGGE